MVGDRLDITWGERCRNAHPLGACRTPLSCHPGGTRVVLDNLLVWKDPEASLELQCAPASSWSLEPSHSSGCLGNITNIVRKRMAKQQCRDLPRCAAHSCLPTHGLKQHPLFLESFNPQPPHRWMSELPVSWITNGNSRQHVWDTQFSTGYQHGGVRRAPR